MEEDDIDELSSMDETQDYPHTTRAIKQCSICHKPKEGKYHLIGKKRVMLTHAQACEGKCTLRSCAHRSHKAKKQTQTTATATMSARDKQAVLAGFKPIDNAQFKQHVQQKLQEAGVDKHIPGPHQLSMVIEAAKTYAESNSTHVKPIKQETSTATSTSTSTSKRGLMNSVVHLLESPSRPTTSTSTSSSTSSTMSMSPPPYTPAKKARGAAMQCEHCSWVYAAGTAHDGFKCKMCNDGVLSAARAGAVFNSLIFESVREMQQIQAEIAAAATATTRATTDARAPTHDTTTTTNTSTSTSTSGMLHVPEMWPAGKNCVVCTRSEAVRFCLKCRSYICDQSSCGSVIHDESALEKNGCEAQDIVFKYTTVGTRSGKSYYNNANTATTQQQSTSNTQAQAQAQAQVSETKQTTTQENNNNSSASWRSNNEIAIDMDDIVDMLPMKVQVTDASTQTTPATADAETQTTYSGPLAKFPLAKLPLTSASMSQEPKPAASVKPTVPFKTVKPLIARNINIDNNNNKENIKL